MKYYVVQPEVAGGWGDHIVVDRSTIPPRILTLHYQFEGWPSDVLVTAHPCFIVTREAKERLDHINATGVTFDQVETSTSELFDELAEKFHKGQQLPSFVWLKVEGKASHDDFGIVSQGELVVSERALNILTELGLSEASISEFTQDVNTQLEPQLALTSDSQTLRQAERREINAVLSDLLEQNIERYSDARACLRALGNPQQKIDTKPSDPIELFRSIHVRRAEFNRKMLGPWDGFDSLIESLRTTKVAKARVHHVKAGFDNFLICTDEDCSVLLGVLHTTSQRLQADRQQTKVI